MQAEKNKVPCGWAVVIGVLVFLFFSLGLALFLSSTFYKVQIVEVQTPEESTEWDHDVERLRLEERGITLIRILSRRRCYIMPEVSDGKTPKHWLIVNDELNQHSIDEIGGQWTRQFCENMAVFMLRNSDKNAPQTISIAKRQAAPEGAATMDASSSSTGGNQNGGSSSSQNGGSSSSSNSGASTSSAPVVGAVGSSGPSPPGGDQPRAPHENINTVHRPSGLDVPIEQREPRCEDAILDCVVSVGKTNTCFTWANGAIKIAQQCLEGNKFRVSMTKPPGRILKLAQEQWKICVERKMQGLKC